MKRRIVSVLMALVMALSLLPVQALAEDAAVGEPVTEIEQAEQTGEGEEPGDPEEQTGEGEEPGDPEEEQEPGEPEASISVVLTLVIFSEIFSEISLVADEAEAPEAMDP